MRNPHNCDPGEEARQLRALVRDLNARLDAHDAGRVRRTPLAVGKVFAQSAVPTALGAFYAAHPVLVSGADAEGATATLTPDTSSVVFMDVLGSQAPAAGDYLVGYSADYRFVAERPGPTPTPTPTNPCSTTWPAVLTYLGSISQSQSAVYFANFTRPYLGPFAVEPPYTLTYGPRPADIPGEMELLFFLSNPFTAPPYYVTMPDNAWWSAPIPATNFNVNINVYFYLWFHGCVANVMVVNAPYSGGSPPGDTLGAGNKLHLYSSYTTTPFAMRAGVFSPTPEVTGTHSGADVTPDANGAGGEWRNGRTAAFRGATSYTLSLSVTAPHGRAPGAPGVQAILSMALGGWKAGPGDTVAWSSSDTSVLTVTPHTENADVTLIAPGTATITAAVTTTHANPTGGPFTASLTVT